MGNIWSFTKPNHQNLENMWKVISNRISAKDYDEKSTLIEFMTNHPDDSAIQIFKEQPNKSEIPGNGDLLVGFYADKDCKFDLVLSNKNRYKDDIKICSFEMKVGDFSYTIQGKFIIPLIGLQFYFFKLENVNSYPTLVYANIMDNQIRQSLVDNRCQFYIETNKNTKPYQIAYGLCGESYDMSKLNIINLPNMLTFTEHLEHK